MNLTYMRGTLGKTYKCVISVSILYNTYMYPIELRYRSRLRHLTLLSNINMNTLHESCFLPSTSHAFSLDLRIDNQLHRYPDF